MRLGVRRAARALAAALDGVWSQVPGRAPVLLESAVGARTGSSLAEAIDTASHLEHLHLYEEATDVPVISDKPVEALAMHTDAGLMLAFVPPVTAEGSTATDGALVEVEDSQGGSWALAPLPSDAVVFFAGQASSLLHGKPSLRPLPHRLVLPRGFGWRAWYGVMLLLPDKALVPNANTGAVMAFGDIWRASRGAAAGKSKDSAEVAPIGCGGQRLLADQVSACSAGEIYCWMTCMSISGLEDCQGTTWQPSGIGAVLQRTQLQVQCTDSQTGRAWQDEMCPTCKPVCVAVGALAPGPSPGPTPADRPDNGFCQPLSIGYGAVMYMDGFRWTSLSPDATCLAFLWGTFIIDSGAKLALACVAVASLGAVVGVLFVVQRLLPAKRQLDLGLLLHLVDLALAYVVMLFVMSYSLELFAASLVGLVAGRMLARWLVMRLKARGGAAAALVAGLEVPMTGTPCCRDPGPLVGGLPAGAVSPSGGEPDGGLHAPLLDSGGAAGETALLEVTGMTCGACESTVGRALKALDGVIDVHVSVQRSQARVLYREPANVALLCETVETVGFGVTPLSPTADPAAAHAVA